jgi:hypothetical protein
VKERPIIFSADMVRAILDGRKTQTRRVVKPQPDHCHRDIVGRPEPWDKKDWERLLPQLGEKEIRCPYGQPGDMLWVREMFHHDQEHNRVFYRADMDTDGTVPYLVDGSGGLGGGVGNARIDRWKSPRYMPRWASRLTLKLTDVRVERLQDIGEEDARTEGVDWASPEFIDDPPDEDPREVGYPSAGASFARDNFRRLWDTLHRKEHHWEDNPWVWALTFDRLEPRQPHPPNSHDKGPQPSPAGRNRET